MTEEDKQKFTSLGINITRSKLEQEIETLQKKLDLLQEVCQHLNVTHEVKTFMDEYGASTRWETTYYNCPDCGKRWTREV